MVELKKGQVWRWIPSRDKASYAYADYEILDCRNAQPGTGISLKLLRVIGLEGEESEAYKSQREIVLGYLSFTQHTVEKMDGRGWAGMVPTLEEPPPDEEEMIEI